MSETPEALELKVRDEIRAIFHDMTGATVDELVRVLTVKALTMYYQGVIDAHNSASDMLEQFRVVAADPRRI